ncbi:hypothetical protein [Leptolyngbya sp. FACHB-261]|uniref:hypothetical protein n=1 Tax=Leptolyngbya sp. FACHB-261 TaxID=2692806 RepID=UPI0016826096|nr:hypothetical protein [Leptolyngbya sp. FACHB-261]MBD2099473.1 hypothetical protein [Leptolyngbya sp. FACHB-261]
MSGLPANSPDIKQELQCPESPDNSGLITLHRVQLGIQPEIQLGVQLRWLPAQRTIQQTIN